MNSFLTVSLINELKRKNETLVRAKFMGTKDNSEITLKSEASVNLSTQEYILVFDEIVRRMIAQQVQNQQICLHEQNLINAVIYYEKIIEAGKNNQGELESLLLNGRLFRELYRGFNKDVNGELIKRLIQIINFHCLTLKVIELNNNYLSDSVLTDFFSILMLHATPALEVISIFQFPNLSEQCINTILKQLKFNISLKRITYRMIDMKPNEAAAWQLVQAELDYNCQLEIAKKTLPILNILFPKEIVEFIIVDFLLGDKNNQQRMGKPLSFNGEEDELVTQMREAKTGLTTLSLPNFIPQYLEKNILAFVKRHHLTLRRIRLPTLNLTEFFWLSLFSPVHSFLKELDISEDKSINTDRLKKLLFYLKTNATLIKIKLPVKPVLSSTEKAIRIKIEKQLNYNQQIELADFTAPIIKEIYWGLGKITQDFDDFLISRLIISYFIGDKFYPQRLEKSVDFNMRGVTVFGKNFQQSTFSEEQMLPYRIGR